MSAKKAPITRREFESQVGNRVSPRYGPGPFRIEEKEFVDSIPIGDPTVIRYDGDIKDLDFYDCIFNEVVEVGNYAQAGKVTFMKCIFNKPVKAQYGNSLFNKECIFNDSLNIYVSGAGIVEIRNFTINGTFEISGSAGTLSINNIKRGEPKINEESNEKKQKLKISTKSTKLHVSEVYGEVLEFSNNMECNDTFMMSNVHVSELITQEIVLNTSMKIHDCNLDKFWCTNITKGNIRELEITNSVIKEMFFKINTLRETSIYSSAIGNLELFGSNEDANILNVIKTTITNLGFSGMVNKGVIALRELTIPKDGILSFHSSNFGKTDFIYCNFTNAKFRFENCKMTEVFFSETKFPKRVFVGDKINYGQAQLVFGQLASAFQKQGDSIGSLEYTSRELEAHYRNLQWLSLNFFQKLTLWLNGISNNFGRNWVRGSIFSFAVGLIFFCLLLISTDKYHWGWPSFDFNLLPAYLKFMNPLRFFELDTLFNNTPVKETIKLNGLSYLADFGGRILIAYGYYQTIQAFRRYGRK